MEHVELLTLRIACLRMDLSVCAASVRATTTRPAMASPAGGLLLRELPCVRFRKEKWRCRGVARRVGVLERRHLLWYGCGPAKLRSGRVVVVASSKSAEGMAVDERTGRRVEIGRSLDELADGAEKLSPQQQQQAGRSLVRALHESARVFMVGLEKQKTLASRPWSPLKWPGVDKNAWMKSLSYQVRGNFELLFLLPISNHSSCLKINFCRHGEWLLSNAVLDSGRN